MKYPLFAEYSPIARTKCYTFHWLNPLPFTTAYTTVYVCYFLHHYEMAYSSRRLQKITMRRKKQNVRKHSRKFCENLLNFDMAFSIQVQTKRNFCKWDMESEPRYASWLLCSSIFNYRFWNVPQIARSVYCNPMSKVSILLRHHCYCCKVGLETFETTSASSVKDVSFIMGSYSFEKLFEWTYERFYSQGWWKEIPALAMVIYIASINPEFGKSNNWVPHLVHLLKFYRFIWWQ